MESGDIVKVYQKSLTREDYEGEAKLVQFMGYGGVYDGVRVQHWLVEFPGDDDGQRVRRQILPEIPEAETLEEKVEKVVKQAEAHFWKRVTEGYPEIKTSNFPPDAVLALQKEMTTSVKKWVKLNTEKPKRKKALAKKKKGN